MKIRWLVLLFLVLPVMGILATPTPTPIAVAITVDAANVTSGNIATVGDVDWYSFASPSVESYDIPTTCITLYDNFMYLFEDDWITTITTADGGGYELSAALWDEELTTGTYYIKIVPRYPAYTGTYTIRVNTYATPVPTATPTPTPTPLPPAATKDDYRLSPGQSPRFIGYTLEYPVFAGTYVEESLTSATTVTLSDLNATFATFDDASTHTLRATKVQIQTSVASAYTLDGLTTPSATIGLSLAKDTTLELPANTARHLWIRATSTTGVFKKQYLGYPEQYFVR